MSVSIVVATLPQVKCLAWRPKWIILICLVTNYPSFSDTVVATKSGSAWLNIAIVCVCVCDGNSTRRKLV